MRAILRATATFSLLSTGCSESFLDRHSLTQLASDNFWQNEKDALLAINGIYDVLQTRVLYSGNLNGRSEEHTSELQSLMSISYAVFCLKKNKHSRTPHPTTSIIITIYIK